VSAFDYDVEIDFFITKLRWERGASSTFTVYYGKDAATNIRIVSYRAMTDGALTSLSRWPDGVVANGTAIPTKEAMADILATYRARVNRLTMQYYDVLDMYSVLTDAMMVKLQVKLAMPQFLFV
jgi:hypothetical protein